MISKVAENIKRTIYMSNFLRLNLGDVGRGLIVAVLAAIFTQLAATFNAPGFELASFDWSETVKIAFASAIGYLGKNLLTDNNGRVLGRFG